MSFPEVNFHAGDAVVGPPMTLLQAGIIWIPEPSGFDSMCRVNGPVGRFVKDRASEIQMTAQSLAPVDTGELRDSIRIIYGKWEGGIYAEIGTDTFYAPFQEYGTIHHAAHPFMRPAVAAVMGDEAEWDLGDTTGMGAETAGPAGRFDWDSSAREWNPF